MKVAVPTKGRNVDDHFGHCEAYTIYTLDDNRTILHTEMLPSPQGCGCKSNIAFVLKEMDVKVMLAGNMGSGALNVLNHHGIEVYRGCTGDVNQLIEAFMQGNIHDSGEGCLHHEHQEKGHVCNHQDHDQ